jgi:3-hydroxyisobutyrate dehydrogenase-like beta-hydroxyacid dehydrogenase
MTAKQAKKTIGFIGLGLMGHAFSRNLIHDGYTVVGTDPSTAARRKFKKIGGAPLDSPKAVAEAADIVFISVPNSKISLKTAQGKEGYLAFSPGLAPEVVIDTTTSDPGDSRKHAELCKKKKVPYLDGCVSGNSGYVAQREGLFLVGGSKRAYNKVAPLLGQMLSDHIYCGRSGSGAELKVTVNYLTTMGRCVISEILRVGLRCGFSKKFLLDALGRSRVGGWAQFQTQAPLMVHEKFSKPMSTLDVQMKDIQLGIKLAERVGAVSPVGKACIPLYKEGIEAGYGDLDGISVYKAYLDREIPKVPKRREKTSQR